MQRVGEIQIYKRKTVLVKWTGEKVVVDIPFEVMEKAMAEQVLKIDKEHYIKTSAINERYGYNVTDELEAWIYETYPTRAEELLMKVKERKESGMRVNKEIVVNIANADA